MALDPVSITLAVIAVISAGASYVQAKKAQKKAKELTEGVEANIESNSKEIPVVYGKRRVGGVRVYIDTSRDKKHQYLYMVLAMAEGEVESITDIKIDDVSIEDDRFNYDGLLSERNLEFEVFLGSDGQEASTLIGNGVSYDYDRLGEIYNDPFADQHERDASDPNRVLPWSSKHKLSGIAYLALKFKWDEGAYTGIPDVTAVVKGRKVYDPRTSTTAWSDNPALCIRDYLTNERFGKGLPASAIDDVAFSQAADDLDSFIAYPYQDSPEYQYLFRMNHVVDTSKKIMENLNDMIIACRGFIPYSNGVYSLKIDQTSSSVLDIGPDQIISGIAVAGARKEDRFNQVKVNFFNASSNYKEDQAIYPEQNSTLYQQYLAEDEGEPLVDEVDLYSINNYYSAREMARLFLERSRQNMTIGFQGTSELINLEVGEVVSITHPTPAWTNKLFQVQEVALAFDGTVQITCIEYDAALYTYDTPEKEQPYVGTRLPDPNQVEPPTALSTTAGTYLEEDGKAIGYIDLSWNAPEDSLVDRYELKFEYSNREEVIELASTEYRFKPTQDNVGYIISVRAVNGLGIRSDWVTAQEVVAVVDTTAPADITGGSVTGGLNQLTLSWTNPSDNDFDLVKIKVGDDNNVNNAIELASTRSDTFIHDINTYETTKYYWGAPVDRTGNVGNYVSIGSATTGRPSYDDLNDKPEIPVVPEVATTVYLTLGNNDAPTTTEFNTAVGRDPIENDFVVVNKEFAFNYKYNTETEVYEWQSVTEFIDGSLLVSGSLSASDITTGTLNADDVTISNLTIAGEQLPNNVAYIKDTKNIAVLINEDLIGANVGEAILVGYTDGSIDRSTDGFITYKGQKYDIQRGSGQRFVIMTTVKNKSGYIVYDSAGTQKFDTGFGAQDNYNIGFAWFDGANWRYDNNSVADGVIFTPADTDLALGIMSTSSSDLIASADLFFEVVKLTEAQEKGTTINYGYLDFATTDEVSGIVSTYTNDQGFISSVNWTDVGSRPTSLSELNSDDGDKLSGIEDNATAGADWNSNVANIPSDIVFDGDITDVVREEQVYANLLIDSDETQQTIPYPVTEASAIEYTINSSVARSEALIVIDALDAEGVTIPNGVQWSLNGVYQSQLNGPDNARVEYKFVVPLIAGDNSIKVWSAGQDGGTVYSVKAYTYESGGGQWFRLSGRANTNAPSNEDFKTAFGRYPAPRDVILIQATSGATASYYFNKTLNAWDNAEAIVHGDLIVSESITALGEVTAGTFSLGNGAFSVNSSGQLSATGAIIDGNITAESLDVEAATVTGTFIAPIGWSDNVYSGVINRENLNESVKDLIDERIAEITGGISGDFGQDNGSFSYIAQGNPDPVDPTVVNITHESGKDLTVELSGSRSWSRYFDALPDTDMGVTIIIERSPAGADTWTAIETLTDGGDFITTTGPSPIHTGTYAYSISIYRVLTDDQASGNYDYRARTTVAGSAYSVGVPIQLTVVEPATVGAGNADTLDNEDGTYYLDYNNFTNTPDLSTKANLSGATFTGDVEIVGNGDTFTLRNLDNNATVGIQFTSQGASATQFGHIRYSHVNGSSYGNNESFTIGGTEASTAILADGNFLYRDGIYKKPATGTGAGIRKDTNWDTAYGWGDHAGLYIGTTKRTGCSNAGAGWYRIARSDASSGRGSFQISFFGYGGTNSPQETIIRGTMGYGTTHPTFISIENARGSRASKVRGVQDDGKCFIEVYLSAALTNLGVECSSFGIGNFRVTDTAVLDPATGTETSISTEYDIISGGKVLLGNTKVVGHVNASSFEVDGTRKDTNWDTAYGWGNHADAGYLTVESYENLQQLTFNVNQADSSTSSNYNIQGVKYSNGRILAVQNITGYTGNSTEFRWRFRDLGEASPSSQTLMSLTPTAFDSADLDVSGSITATGYNDSNWNTAYGWGNHASAGYLTAESDTLADVTGRGSTTNSSLTLNGKVSFGSNGTYHYSPSGARANNDARDSGDGVRLHRWNRNHQDTAYLPYYENWYDGNSYHSIGVDTDRWKLSDGLDVNGTITATDATLSGGDLRIYNDASNYGRILFGESATDGNVIIEYDGTGSGATNYLNFYSDVSGWMTKGSSLNIQPSTGNVAVGSNTYTDKFNVTGTIRADSYKVGTTTVIDSSRNADFVDGTFTGNLDVITGGASGQIRVGRTSNQSLLLNVNDRTALIEHTQDETTGEHIMQFNINSPTALANKSFDFTNGSIKVGGTQVIDASRNLTNIGTGSFSGNVVLSGSGNSARLTVGGSRIISVSGSSDVVWQNLGQLRVSDRAEYDWDDWGGIKYVSASSMFVIGGSNSAHFSNNSGTSAIINFDGVSDIRHNGTTVIDSSRNLTNIGTISSGAITPSSHVTIINGAELRLKAGTNEDIGDIVYQYNNGSEKHRLWDGGADGLNYRYNGGTSYRIGVNTNTNSLAINGTTVIDSSRNLTNIASITASGRINPSNPNAYWQTSVTGLTNAPIYFPESNVGANSYYLPWIHSRTLQDGGYRTHVNVGVYKNSGNWNGNGLYVALGGNDSYPTENFLLSYGGVLSHSQGHIVTPQLRVGDGNDGYFYSDTNGRTAFRSGDFYIQSSVGNYYNYATNQYHGNSSGDNHYFRSNYLGGTNWDINSSGDLSARSFEVSGTTVIDSSRNLTNITNLSGSVLSSGSVIHTYRGGKDINDQGTYILSKDDGGWTGGDRMSGAHNGYGVISMHLHTGSYYGQIHLSAKTHDMGVRFQNNTGWSHIYKVCKEDSSGNLTVSGNVTAYSDITLKDNITNIDNALDKVNSIRGVTYDRIDQDNARHAGVIAQEVEAVLPEVVHTDDNGIKSVAYGNMVGLLIEAIKELKSEIEVLKNGTNSN